MGAWQKFATSGGVKRPAMGLEWGEGAPSGAGRGFARLPTRKTAFRTSIAGAGLRARARDGVERAVLARLEMTGFLRGAPTLHRLEGDAGEVAYWFTNQVFGIPVGLAEGVILARDGDSALHWAAEVARRSGAVVASLNCTAARAAEEGKRAESYAPSAGLRVVRLGSALREVLPLGPDFEQTLAALGRHTRRNVRNACKLAAGEGIKFAFETIADPERFALTRATEPYPLGKGRVRALEGYAEQTGTAFRSTLRAQDGTVFSYSCGFVDGTTAYLVYQLNDRSWSRVGPSLMHRGFLLEALVARGCSELVFVHGCSGTLRHSCPPVASDHYWVMRSRSGRLATEALARLRPSSILGKAGGAALEAFRAVG